MQDDQVQLVGKLLLFSSQKHNSFSKHMLDGNIQFE